jgi:hypothetical protein
LRIVIAPTTSNFSNSFNFLADWAFNKDYYINAEKSLLAKTISNRSVAETFAKSIAA